MKTTLKLGAVTLVTAASLAACGSADYCDTYKKAQEDVGDFDVSDVDNYEKIQDYIGQLRDAAPNDDVEQAWKTADETFSKINTNLEEAGMSFSDLKKLTDAEGPEDLPDGVSKKDALKFAQNMRDLRKNSNMDEAKKTIDDYAENNCEAE